MREMVADLVAHHVAITSTLAIFETMAGNRPPMERESAALKTLNVEAAKDYLTVRASRAEQQLGQALLHKEMLFEHEFVAAGGLLMAGCDPTGYGGVVPGFGDQRNLELAGRGRIHPGRSNSHCFTQRREIYGQGLRIGSIARGKAADIVVLAGTRGQDRECRKGGDGSQGWRRLRLGRAHPVSERDGRNSLTTRGKSTGLRKRKAKALGFGPSPCSTRYGRS